MKKVDHDRRFSVARIAALSCCTLLLTGSAAYAVPDADISITKTDGVTEVYQGGSVTYTIVVTNNGPFTDSQVSVTDLFPAVLTCTFTSSASSGATGNTASGSGDISDSLFMPDGSSVTYTADCGISPSAEGQLVNTATAIGHNYDPNQANNSATDSSLITPAPPDFPWIMFQQNMKKKE